MSDHRLVRSRKQSSGSWAPRRPSIRAQRALSGIRYQRMAGATNPEQKRPEEANAHREPWRKRGPYVSDRQRGTAREDYNDDDGAWDRIPPDHHLSPTLSA